MKPLFCTLALWIVYNLIIAQNYSSYESELNSIISQYKNIGHASEFDNFIDNLSTNNNENDDCQEDEFLEWLEEELSSIIYSVEQLEDELEHDIENNSDVSLAKLLKRVEAVEDIIRMATNLHYINNEHKSIGKNELGISESIFSNSNYCFPVSILHLWDGKYNILLAINETKCLYRIKSQVEIRNDFFLKLIERNRCFPSVSYGEWGCDANSSCFITKYFGHINYCKISNLKCTETEFCY